MMLKDISDVNVVNTGVCTTTKETVRNVNLQ